jgi:SepF-like predicted cell division protein (DUF552 family)
MKRSGWLSAIFYYLAVLPTALWIMLHIPGITSLMKKVPKGALTAALSLLIGLLLAEICRRLLRNLGRKRQLQNSLSPDKRTYPLKKQLITTGIITIALFITSLVLYLSPLVILLKTLQLFGSFLLELLKITTESSWPRWIGAPLLLFGGVFLLASPFRSKLPPKYKTYSLEMYTPWLCKIPLFSPERFVLRYLSSLVRTDFLNRFDEHTVFAGRIHCLHEGIATVWYVTYDERTMQPLSEQRPLHGEHIKKILDAIASKEQKEASISHSIIAEVAKDHQLLDGDGKIDLGDLTREEIQRIIQALAASGYDNLLTLDIDNLQSDDRARQSYEKRLQELAQTVNRFIAKQSGSYEIDIYRRDKKLTTKVLQFKVDPIETIRRSTEEYGGKIGPQHSLLVATLRGASGEHADGFDEENETVGDELEGLESIAGGASALDHVAELNPSMHQLFMEAKGFGRAFDIQLGKESYQVITEWLRSGGANPLSGWRLLRCSKVINGDGNVVARRTQGWRDLIPHLLGTIGLGKEWSHVKITDPALHNQDKLPLALLALDIFESNDFKNRRRILKAASISLASSK